MAGPRCAIYRVLFSQTLLLGRPPRTIG